MSRISHGQLNPPGVSAQDNINATSPGVRKAQAFGYLFPDLQETGNGEDNPSLLPERPETVSILKRLGRAMCEETGEAPRHSTIPSLYTYFGQCLDHEITHESKSSDNARAKLHDPKLAPLSLEIISKLPNKRTPRLDLDCIYGQSTEENKQLRDGNRMRLGAVAPVEQRPPGKEGNDFDLPRLSSTNSLENCQAIIGDARNDENVIITQLHVAFLRAHNVLVDKRKLSYDDANLALRQHFQWIVLDDFIRRIADPEIVTKTLTQVLANDPERVYRPSADELFMPLEFSAAAYRFGHSMVRNSYRLNELFPPVPMGQLFTRAALNAFRGQRPAGEPLFDAMPQSWIIDWGGFIDGGQNQSRRIGTRLTNHLAKLRDSSGNPLTDEAGRPLADEAILPVRNLLRGYLLRLPTGQAVAKKLGLPVMTAEEMEKAVGPAQAEILREEFLPDTKLSMRTPLWYYILAEVDARIPNHLGPVGSSIVAGVLIELIRQSKDSILEQPDWQPTLGRMAGKFTLPDLLKLGGGLEAQTLLPVPGFLPPPPIFVWPQN